MKCRHCAAELERVCLDLGSAPPSNAYLSEAALRAPEVWYPLRLLVCERCWLVQTEDHAGREALFSDDYAYFSSFSSSWLAHARAYVEAMRTRFALTPASLVCEVAANDGYLLRYVRDAGIPCYGVEPTASTATRGARARARHRRALLRRRARARARRRRPPGRPRRGQQRARPRARHQRLRRRLRGAAEARRRRDLRVPAPAEAPARRTSSTPSITSTTRICR